MSLTTTTADQLLLQLAEEYIKQAMTEGLDASQADALMTFDQYRANGDSTYQYKARDVNRITAAGLFRALRALPLQLPTYAVSGVPAAADYVGALIYVSNGAAGNPVVAFSDGSNWLRVDTRAAISP